MHAQYYPTANLILISLCVTLSQGWVNTLHPHPLLFKFLQYLHFELGIFKDIVSHLNMSIHICNYHYLIFGSLSHIAA